MEEYRIIKKTSEDESTWYYIQKKSKFLGITFWPYVNRPGEDGSYVSSTEEGANKLLEKIIKNRKSGDFPKEEVIKQIKM